MQIWYKYTKNVVKNLLSIFCDDTVHPYFFDTMSGMLVFLWCIQPIPCIPCILSSRVPYLDTPCGHMVEELPIQFSGPIIISACFVLFGANSGNIFVRLVGPSSPWWGPQKRTAPSRNFLFWPKGPRGRVTVRFAGYNDGHFGHHVQISARGYVSIFERHGEKEMRRLVNEKHRYLTCIGCTSGRHEPFATTFSFPFCLLKLKGKYL